MSEEYIIRLKLDKNDYLITDEIITEDEWGHRLATDIELEPAPPEDWEYYYNLGKIFEATHEGALSLVSEEDSEPDGDFYQCKACHEFITEKEYKELMDMGMPYCMCEYAYIDENGEPVYTRILNEYVKVEKHE